MRVVSLSLSLCQRKGQLLEDLYRANFNLGNIFFRNGQKSDAVRCLEQAKECARKTKDKFSESECFHCIGKVKTIFFPLEISSTLHPFLLLRTEEDSGHSKKKIFEEGHFFSYVF